VSGFLSRLVIAAIAANVSFAADTNPVIKAANSTAKVSEEKDPLAKELEKLEADDDAAMEEVDGWIIQNHQFAEKGAGIPAEELNRRIRKRFETVEKAYEDFIKPHPN
jgi:hypothetical protein